MIDFAALINETMARDLARGKRNFRRALNRREPEALLLAGALSLFANATGRRVAPPSAAPPSGREARPPAPGPPVPKRQRKAKAARPGVIDPRPGRRPGPPSDRVIDVQAIKL
jgi:hypothetical protein